MVCPGTILAARVAGRSTFQVVRYRQLLTARSLATVSTTPPAGSTSKNHKVVVIGGGAAGLAASHRLLRRGAFAPQDIAIIDPATWHDYQPGWTLVGGGLKAKDDFRTSLADLIDPKLKFYNDSVASISPDQNLVTLGNGDHVSYEQLVVAPGMRTDLDSIQGLSKSLSDPSSTVSSIYTYNTCDKVFRNIQTFREGVALFTQPGTVIKCAGAPQKIMWLALDFWRRAGLYDPLNPSRSAIQIVFATGLPTMFGVPKYSAKLEELRRERNVEGLFQHDLVSIDGNRATFARPNGEDPVTREFGFLHAVPKMGGYDFVRESGLANEAGFVNVDERTTRHRSYPNIWSVGDASGLPTSKTIAAITSQVPVLVQNLLYALEGKDAGEVYDGYTSCPLVTEYGKVLLAEFKYGGEPKETFGDLLGIDQAVPRRAFYHMKKDFFPWVYSKSMVKGTWGGPKGWLR